MIAMYPHNRTWKTNRQPELTLAETNKLTVCLLATVIGLNVLTLVLWLLELLPS